MGLIGMPEAARRAGVARTTIQRALEAAGVQVHRINDRAVAVDEAALAAFIAARAGYKGRGRPAGARNKGPRPDRGRPRARTPPLNEGASETAGAGSSLVVVALAQIGLALDRPAAAMREVADAAGLAVRPFGAAAVVSAADAGRLLALAGRKRAVTLTAIEAGTGQPVEITVRPDRTR